MSKLYKSAFEYCYGLCASHFAVMNARIGTATTNINAESFSHLYHDGIYSISAVFRVPQDGQLNYIRYWCTASDTTVSLDLNISYNVPITSGVYILYVTSYMADATLSITLN